MKKSRADYSYAKVTMDGIKFIAIQDKDCGGMSVTNDIENVVAEICEREAVKQKDYLIVYCDSMGIWDAWNGNDFVSLNQPNLSAAIDKYIHLKKEKV